METRSKLSQKIEKKTVQSEGSVMYHVLSPLSILHRKISMEDVHRQRYFQGVYASSLNNYMPYVLGRKKNLQREDSGAWRKN